MLKNKHSHRIKELFSKNVYFSESENPFPFRKIDGHNRGKLGHKQAFDYLKCLKLSLDRTDTLMEIWKVPFPKLVKTLGKILKLLNKWKKNTFRYCMHVIHIYHLQLIAWKGALFCFSTDSVQFTENTVNTYLYFVGEMGMNTWALSHQSFIANLCNFHLESIMYGTEFSLTPHKGAL